MPDDIAPKPLESPTPAPSPVPALDNTQLKQVPEITVHPDWALSKEDWDARSAELEELKSKLSGSNTQEGQ